MKITVINTIEKDEDVMNILEELKSTGKMFYVIFKKRTNGETRRMVCRGKVHKGIKGKGLAFDPQAKKLISVYDMRKAAFRFIPIEGVRMIKSKDKLWIKV